MLILSTVTEKKNRGIYRYIHIYNTHKTYLTLREKFDVYYLAF